MLKEKKFNPFYVKDEMKSNWEEVDDGVYVAEIVPETSEETNRYAVLTIDYIQDGDYMIELLEINSVEPTLGTYKEIAQYVFSSGDGEHIDWTSIPTLEGVNELLQANDIKPIYY